ncbi:ankyrin repeat-containing protein NPR4-like [Panicum hallii]|nr:ankyrin repeat-containing protein NPR4-like [Panicum hallii]
MDTIQLMKAATTGDVEAMRRMDPAVLSERTPAGNTCLHIASIHGHQAFCQAVLDVDSHFLHLLAAVNADGETPLLVAVTSGHISLASFFLPLYKGPGLSDALTKQDKHECNALHHAIRSGHNKELALRLIAAAPSLSRAANKYGESPMFIAAMRDYQDDVLDRLLEIPDSADGGAGGNNALHAAVRNGNSGIAKKIIQARPQLAREEDVHNETPVHLAVLRGHVDVLRVLLEHDQTLGYLVCSDGTPLLNIAALRGYVSAAREILDHCPDTPYGKQNGSTCLHVAVQSDEMEFVNFVLTSQQLRKLVNMRDQNGMTALHHSVRKCMPKMLAALLRHPDIDVTVLTNKGSPATWLFDDAIKSAKSLQWNEVSMMLLNADPKRATNIYNLHKEIKDKITDESRKIVKSLTETYTRNTSIVAILMASITFTAALTLSGWYRSDAAGSQGLPIMAKKFAFQAFLISDTLAMCSSLSVAFICVIARWEDFEFLLYYRSMTNKIMWFAYMATSTAFATGLYTVLAPRLLPLAIAICCLPVLLPILTMLLGRWPVLRLQFRLGRSFKSDLLDMV